MGVGDHVEEVIHLFFADNTLLFCESYKRVMLHLRCVLMGFQVVLGLNINLSKSEIARLGDESDADSLARVMGCKIVRLLIKFLGLSLGANFKAVGT